MDIKADRTKTVEMDPESGRLALEKANKRGQNLIGWYHSHPQFQVDPSNIDVSNHQTYQQNFERDGHPFVALIIGTYWTEIESKGLFTSQLRCFHNTELITGE